MSATLLTAGIACLIAAIVGGGLKAFGIEIPPLQSRIRQAALAGVGMLLLFFSLMPTFPPAATPSPNSPAQTATVTQPVATKQPELSAAAMAPLTKPTVIAPGGPPVTVTTTVPGERVRLSFEGRVGQIVSLKQQDSAGRADGSTRAGCLYEITDLLGPDGQKLATTDTCRLIEPTRLPANGTYTIEVRMDDSSSTANLTVTLYNLPQ